MSIFFDQDFEGLLIGSGPPPGFNGEGQVIAGGANGSSKSYQLGSNAGISTNLGSQTTVAACSIFCWVYISGDIALPNALINLKSLDTITGIGAVVFTLGFEQDSSISCRSFNKNPFGNSGVPFQRNRWTFLQCNVTFGSGVDPISGLIYMTAACDLALGGQLIISNALSGLTNELVSNLPVTYCNTYEFIGSQVLIDSITGEDQVPINTYPHPGTPSGRVSQLAMEYAELPNSSNARVSQLVIEDAIIPTPFVRISQLVIELMANIPGGSGSNVRIYEA